MHVMTYDVYDIHCMVMCSVENGGRVSQLRV